jgi:hypothetical protein
MTDDFVACLGCNQTLGIGQSEYCPKCRASMHPEKLWEAANQWPAEERGDKRDIESGWEGLANWEKAARLEFTEADKIRYHSAKRWLHNIRSNTVEKADRRWLDMEYCSQAECDALMAEWREEARLWALTPAGQKVMGKFVE